jgi:hypothetical protein
MNLHITELEQIPENSMIDLPEKPVKNVRFANESKNMIIEKPFKKTQVTYEDILSKMNMYVSDGKLHLKETSKNAKQPMHSTSSTPITDSQMNQLQTIPQHQNSYIYNKYFKNSANEEPIIRRPRTLSEYKHMIVMDKIQNERIQQIKSRKLIMPTTNINISTNYPSDLNKLFSFSKR